LVGGEGLMEISIDDIVVLMKDDTFITGRISGLKFRGENLEVMWIHGIEHGLYLSDGWRIERNITNDEEKEIENLNRMLEDNEDE
jgi:hypothetical protein